MVICNFDFCYLTVSPDEAKSILVIDSYAVLPFSVSLESLQTIPWRHSQIIQFTGLTQIKQFSTCHPFDVPKFRDIFISKEGLGAFIPEGFDHE
jgi:hypothetical protein